MTARDSQRKCHRCSLPCGNTTSAQSCSALQLWPTRLHWFKSYQKRIIPVGIKSMSSLTENFEDQAQCTRNKHAHLLLEQSSQSRVQQRLLRKDAECRKPEVSYPVVWINLLISTTEHVWLNQEVVISIISLLPWGFFSVRELQCNSRTDKKPHGPWTVFIIAWSKTIKIITDHCKN